MKKTLFLALAFGLTGLSHATVEKADGIIHVYGEETTTPSDSDGVVNVGSYKGAGVVTMDSDWAIGNSLFIGGVGYRTGKTVAHSGKVTVTAGTTLVVGVSTSTAAGSHIDVGNSALAEGEGELIIDGGTVKAEQLVVGREGGAKGTVTIKNGGTLDVQNTKTDTGDDYHGILIYNGELVVEQDATLNNEELGTYIGDTEGASLTVAGEANLGDVIIGDTGSGEEGALNIEGGKVTVIGDMWVSETSTLTVTEGTLTVGETTDGGIWVDQNAKVDISGTSAVVEAARIELAQNASMTIAESAVVNSSMIGLQSGAQVEMTDNAMIADKLGQEVTIAIDPGADIYMKDETTVSVSNVIFTVTAENQDAESAKPMGQIHCETAEALTQIKKASVVIDGSYLNSLVNGEREIVLVSAPVDTDAHADPDTIEVVWGTHADDNFNDENREISYTVKTEGDAEGVKLQLSAQNPDNPNQGADDLSNQIIDALVTPTSTATINTLNGTISALGGLFNVVKSQLQMPHNVEQPVGKIADDSRLAYTGRYYVGANRAWASGLGASDRVATDSHGLGYHYVGGGYAVGYDRVVTPEMYVGAALGQMIGKYKANNDLVKDNQVTYEGTLYAHYTHEMKKSDNRFNVDAYIGGGRARNRAHGVLAEGSKDRATGRWDDTSIGGGVRLSYDIVLSDAHIVTPFVGIEGIHAWQDDYTISNGKTSLRYHDGKASLWTVPVGVTYRYIASIDKTEYLVPHVTVAYLGDISRKEPRVKYDWTSGSGEVRGAKPACSGFELEAGITWILNSEWSTGAFYTLDQRTGDCYQQVKAFVSYSF